MKILNVSSEVTRLIPHRGTMLLLESVMSISDENARGASSVRSSNPFLCLDGTLAVVAFVELLAQLAAAWQGSTNQSSSKSGSGYLVSMRDFHFRGAAREGDMLELVLSRVLNSGPFHVLDGFVNREEELLASGQIRVYSGEAATIAGDTPLGIASRNVRFETELEKRLSVRSAGMDHVDAEVTLESGFPGLEGHFPGEPIIPAAVLLEACRICWKNSKKAELQMTQILDAKFLRKVVPGDSLLLELKMSEAVVDARILNRGQESARIRFVAV